jgi:hypothetical protein
MNTLIKVGLFGVAAYIAYKQGWLAKLGIGAETPATTTARTGGILTTAGGVETPLTGPAPTLDGLYTRMVALAAKNGVTTTGPDGWNYYLNETGLVSGLPDPLEVFPGVDRTQPMTSAEYWAGMSAWLARNKGLSGPGIFGGLAGLIYCGGLC